MTERARPIIACFSVALLVLGVLLALDLPAKFGIPFSATEWGYTFFSLGADVAVVYLIIDRLLLRDERKRWKAVEGKAIELVQTELTGLVSFVGRLLLPPMDVSDPSELRLSRMKEIVKLPSEEFEKSVDPKIEEKASLFRESSRRLASLQTRYSFKLRPELINLVMDVESLLESISSDLEDPTTDALRSFALFQFQLLIERLVKAIDDGLIQMLQLPKTLAI